MESGSRSCVRGRTRGTLDRGDIDGWYYEGGDVWTVDLASGTASKLLDAAFGPAYSPDGARLAVDAQWAGPRRIWLLDANGHNPRQVTTDSSEAVIHAEPRWSPDGSKLAFRRIEKNKSDIAVVDIASQVMTRVTDDNVTGSGPGMVGRRPADLLQLLPRREPRSVAHSGRTRRPAGRHARAAHDRSGRGRGTGARTGRTPNRVRRARHQLRHLAAFPCRPSPGAPPARRARCSRRRGWKAEAPGHRMGG